MSRGLVDRIGSSLASLGGRLGGVGDRHPEADHAAAGGTEAPAGGHEDTAPTQESSGGLADGAEISGPAVSEPHSSEMFPSPVCRFDSKGRFIGANSAYYEWSGRDPSEAGGGDMAIAMLRLKVGQALAGQSDADAGPSVSLSGVPLKTGRGETATVSVTILSPRSAGARKTSDMGEIWTILVPDAAKAPEKRFDWFLDVAPFGVALVDKSGRIKQSNTTFRDLIGYRGDRGAPDVLGYIEEADREALRAVIARPDTKSALAEATEIRVTGKEGLFLAALSRSANVTKRDADVMLYFFDVSSTKALEQQIVQSQKMQAVGQLAGGVAHDFNNLLTAMTGFCDLLLLRHRPGDQSFSDVMQIYQNANRAANLVRQLLAFSRQQTLIPRVLDVTETLAELSHLLRRLIGENISLKIEHERELANVKVDQGQLDQVVINLVVNARDAMPAGGDIMMRTSNVQVETPVREGDEVMPPGRYVLIEVSDTGTGIPPEIVDRIFEPFFSTKEVGSGTGLGLSTVYGIVKQTGGFIFVKSSPNDGTTFSIFLPAHVGDAEPSLEIPTEGAAATRDLTGAGTILLVEDEDPVRLFAARALRAKGYKVFEARSGEAALDLLTEDRSTIGEIDLLITDVVMPGVDGPTLIKRIREDRADIRVICISGYSEDALRQRISEDAGIHFLPKPFSLKQLAFTVKTVLSDTV